MEEPPLGRLVQLTYRALDTAISNGVRERGFDVGLPHSAVLAHIDIKTGTRATVLAERAGVSKQAMGELVTDLANKGFVERRPDPTDGRAKLVCLTPEGQRLIDAAFAVIEEIEATLRERVGDRSLKQVRRSLVAVLDALDRSKG